MPKTKTKRKVASVMRRYTVVGFYTDTEQPYVTHVVSSSPEYALKRVFFENRCATLVLIEVFSGHQDGLGRHDKYLSCPSRK